MFGPSLLTEYYRLRDMAVRVAGIHLENCHVCKSKSVHVNGKGLQSQSSRSTKWLHYCNFTLIPRPHPRKGAFSEKSVKPIGMFKNVS